MTEDLRGLLSYIYRYESRGGDYNIVHGKIPADLRPKKPLTEMTVAEVLAWQDEIDPLVGSEAAGAMQIMPDTLRGLVEDGKVDPNALFDADTQDAITVSLLEGRGLREWQSGAISTETFGNRLAMEWAGLPLLGSTYKGNRLLARGDAYYGGDGLNPSRGLSSPEELEAVLANPAQYDASQWRTTVSTSGQGRWEPGVGIQRSGTAEYQAEQFGGLVESSVPSYPWRGSADLNNTRRNMLALPNADPALSATAPDLPHANYSTRTGAGGGANLDATTAQAFADEFTDSFLLRGAVDDFYRSRSTYDMNFDPIAEAIAKGYSHDETLFLSSAENGFEFFRLEGQIKSDRARAERRAVYDGWAAPALGGILNPDSLVSMALPGGLVVSGMRRAGVNAAASTVTGGLLSGATEAVFETGRARLDSTSTPSQSMMQIGMATALGGLFSGAVAGAVTPAARRRLATKIGDDLARQRGIGGTTTEIEIGRGRKATIIMDDGNFFAAAMPEGQVRAPRAARVVDVNGKPVLAVIDSQSAKRGVFRVGDQIVVSAARIAERFKAGDMPAGIKTPNELMEYEIGYMGALARKVRSFFKSEDGAVGPRKNRADPTPFVKISDSGEVVVDRARLEAAINSGDTVRLGDGGIAHITPIEVEAAAFESVDQLEAAVRKAHDFAMRARDDGEFRRMVEGIFGRKLDEVEPEDVVAARAKAQAEAEAEAVKHLESWRAQNNKILQDARVEAFARIMDSPYKRIHRNALSGATRDIADLLAADGGFLRGADGKGVNLGPSVYSRAKTWQGMVDRLYRKERELYAKYLGLESNPGVAGVNLSDFKRKRVDGSKAIPMRDWRRMVTRVHVTGISSGVAEIDEMATHLKGVLDEYHVVADTYGVVTGQRTISAQIERLRERLASFSAKELEAGKGDDISAQLDRLAERLAMQKKEPSEDYFTRVWSRKAIAENREAFLERVVKPWMSRQNRVDVWEPGKDDIARTLDQMEAAKADRLAIEEMERRWRDAPERGQWKTVEASTAPADIQARAERMVDEILGEAEPDLAAAHRDPVRPTFGRHRQFDIPNRMLLKDGPEGNGIADFIETDYLLVQRVYADRMGPAIELSRTFGNLADGVSGPDGFEAALDFARMTELSAWSNANKAALAGKSPEETARMFSDHWAPMERDMLHLFDRVANRVIRQPDRWDNRAATVLKDWSRLTFMGLSGLNALQETGALIMRHGATKVFRAAFMSVDSEMEAAMKAGVMEMQKAGAILDVAMGGALSSFAETGMDATYGSTAERWIRAASNRYFNWNGLAPITARFKELDAMIRVHDTLEKIDMVRLGVATEEQIADLSRFGISVDTAKRISREPIMQNEGGHWLANTDMWGDEDLVRTFRAAIAQGNENTILMATAADKPIIVDGTAYIRKGGFADQYARRLGLREVGDYWQVQSGLMSLPFSFWNYGIAATNKLLLSSIDDPSAQKLSGLAAMIGLGYMIAQVRTDPGQWQGLSIEDRVARAVDQSGVTGLVGTYANLFQGASIATLGVNPLPFERTRGLRTPSLGDMAEQIAGAGPSAVANLARGIANGDLAEARYGLPLANYVMTGWMWGAAIDGLDRRNAGLD